MINRLAQQARLEAAIALAKTIASGTPIPSPVLIVPTVEGRVVYVEAGNPQTPPYKVTTTDQTSMAIVGAVTQSFVFPLGDIPVPDESTVRVHCVVTMRQSFVGAGAPASAEYELLFGLSRRNGGAPVAMRGTNPTYSDVSGTNGGAPPVAFTPPTIIDINTVGTTWVIQIQATGVVGETIDCSVIAEWQIST
jgi:hypothetical protein